jgi:hypothetical protein
VPFVFFSAVIWSIDELRGFDAGSMKKIHNERLHSSVHRLNIFLECWNKGPIEQNRDEMFEDKIQNLPPLYKSNIGNTHLAQFMKFSDSAFSADEF